MGNHVITSSNSIVQNLLDGIADANANAFFFIAEDAHVISLTNDGIDTGAEVVSITGGARITVKGSVIGALAGIRLGFDADPTLNDQGGSSSVTVSASGLVEGYNGIAAWAGGHAITNEGMIVGNGFGGPAIFMSGPGNTIVNSGSIIGDFGVYVFAGDSVPASGSITNTGLIAGHDILGASSIGIRIIGVYSLVNSGTITGEIAISMDDANTTTIFNSGTIASITPGGIALLRGAATGGVALTNTGLIEGTLLLGSGVDTIDNALGLIRGAINLGAGDDTLIGGAASEVVTGGNGVDTVSLGGGDDRFVAGNRGLSASDGNDAIDGGAGVDTYDASGQAIAVTVDLDAERATGVRIGTDSIINFENVIGTNQADTLVGDAGDNMLNGAAGSDALDGREGNDHLVGGTQADTLIGGLGRDVMSAGLGNFIDTFVFEALGDSGIGGAARDVIADFVSTGAFNDIINLAAIDANSGIAGDQAFALTAGGGTGAFTAAGQLRFQALGANTLVQANVDANLAADFSILLRGTHALDAGDFVL